MDEKEFKDSFQIPFQPRMISKKKVFRIHFSDFFHSVVKGILVFVCVSILDVYFSMERKTYSLEFRIQRLEYKVQ